MNCLVLVFSRDRALQLDATLRSFLSHCQDSATVHIRVLYTTTDESHAKQYRSLEQDYAPHTGIQFVREQIFRSDVLALLALFDHVLFLVDDNIFVRNFTIQEGMSVLSTESSVLSVSLRLGRNTTYCYPLDSQQALPPFSTISSANTELLKFRWVEAQHDFNYPLEVSSSLYRTDDLYDVMSSLSFSNPNSLEGQLAEQKGQFSLSAPDLVCYGYSVTFCNPLNMVQIECVNRAATDPQVTSAGLAEKFRKGYRVDVDSYVNFTPHAAHQEVDLRLTSGINVGPDMQPSTSPVVVSVVIPCYNQCEFLFEAVESVVQQSYQNWEIIIVDDGSTDDTPHVAETLKKEFAQKNIHLVQQKNQGLASARNAGIQVAKGQYILPLDADDCLHADMLEKTVQLLEKDPSVAIAYTDTVTFGLREEVWPTGDLVLEDECENNRICYCSLFRRDMWEDVGGYNPNMIWGYEDWDFWISCLEKGYSGKRVPERLFRYRLREGTMYSRALKNDVKLKAQIVVNHPQLYDEVTHDWAIDLLRKNTQQQSASLPESIQNTGTLSMAQHTQMPTSSDRSNPKESFGSDNALPLVSVIVPTYNRPERLRETLASILEQTYSQYEVIVVNDGGLDVGDLVESFNDKKNIHYVRHGINKGLAAARNSGIGIARGKYLAYLDDDDRFLPHHLKTLVSYLEKSSCRVAYSDAWRVSQLKDGVSYVEHKRDVPYSYDFNADMLLLQNYFPVLCVMHEKACLDKAGVFDETLTTHEDWDLWIRLSRDFSFGHVKEVTAEFTWRIDGSSMTSDNPADFLRTKKIIYKKYQQYFDVNPHLVSARDQELKNMALQRQKPSFDCSIIIPVCNKVELTQQCLSHLSQVTQGCSYEVVVVDNGSSDGTQEFLAMLQGDLQIIRNESNLGFAKACNQGAHVAKGQYLVFLNNDTIPKPGWLIPLVDEVRSHDEVAVVGSKLLYPDNTIQHSGVVFARLFQTPYHLFAGRSENCPAVNIRREFQAVTAACMLIRKEIFEEVGGFDEGFVNGFEDVDLCLRIRQLGQKIIYQPKSCLYHLESQTPGRKNHDAANSKRFLSRWQHQWLIDEDLVAYQQGYFNSYVLKNNVVLSHLTPIHEMLDSDEWKRVGVLQKLLLGQKCQPLSELSHKEQIWELLVEVDEWPNDIGVLEWVGEVCEILQCERQAVQYWEKLLMHVDHPNARLGLVRVHLKSGNFDEAQQHLDVLKDGFTPRAEGWLLQGILSMQRQNYSEAKWACEQSLAIDSENIKGRIGLGMACMGLEQISEAWDAFNHVVSDNPDHVEAIRCLIQAGTALQRWKALAGAFKPVC